MTRRDDWKALEVESRADTIGNPKTSNRIPREGCDSIEETAMAITYEQAEAKLHEWTDSPALRGHARAVEAAMRRAAHRYGAAADEPRWAMTGLLHDADYDRWPDEHPR